MEVNLSSSSFSIRSIIHTTNIKSSVQLVFVKYMILPIEHVTNGRLIYQRKQWLIDRSTDK